MILPDVNVLLYAFRSDSQDHRRYKEWIESIVNGPSPYGMSPQVLAAVIRISTHPRIFVQPSSLESALAFAGVLLAQPHCQMIAYSDDVNNRFRGDVNNFLSVATLAFAIMPRLFT